MSVASIKSQEVFIMNTIPSLGIGSIGLDFRRKGCNFLREIIFMMIDRPFEIYAGSPGQIVTIIVHDTKGKRTRTLYGNRVD